MEGKRCKSNSIQYTTVVGVKSTAYLHFPGAIGTRNIYIWGIIVIHSAHLCPRFRWRVLIAISATNDVFTSLQHSFASYCQAEPKILSFYFLSVSSSQVVYFELELMEIGSVGPTKQVAIRALFHNTCLCFGLYGLG